MVEGAYGIEWKKRLYQREVTSKVKGVYFHKSIGKWVARITIDGKRVNLGSFNTEEEEAISCILREGIQ